MSNQVNNPDVAAKREPVRGVPARGSDSLLKDQRRVIELMRRRTALSVKPAQRQAKSK